MHASIAERFAYGTPIDRELDDVHIYNAPRSGTALVGRILLAAIFMVSGIAKLTDPTGAIGYMNMAGIPSADTLVYVAGAAEILGGTSLVLGLLARVGALGLTVMLVIITFYFHAFWTMDGAEAKAQMVNFMKNLGLMGGLLMVVAHGPGAYSLDARLRRPLSA